ncbi:MAG: nucleotide exchange factor GrpE [bacterium]|nr:nucleotide exchange factor GrpE [bacterium]
MFSTKKEDDGVKSGATSDEQDEKGGNELELLKKQLEEEKKKSAEYHDHWKRAMADFQNYKKRQSELFGELVGAANQELILALLPIFDTFTLAVKHIPEDLKDKEWTKGVTQLKEQLASLLKSKGLEEIKSIGEKFDPEFHEAVEIVESKKQEGEILEEVQKGYKLNGMVIRTAKVKVAKK